MKRELRVIISGGGTGGHIFPALAIANAIKKNNPTAEFLFVGAKGKMEMEKVPAAGYKIEGLWISGLQRKLTLTNLLFPLKVISSIMRSYALIRKFKPDVAIGVGGYASGPMLYAAAGKKIPALIQEQNSYPGITNKILAKRVKKICVAFKGMEKYFPAEKIILTGNPVRENMVDIEGKKAEAHQFFNLDPSRPVILVVGGSQGARSINLAIESNLNLLGESNIQLIWQCGKLFYQRSVDAINKMPGNMGLHSYDFITRMDLAYAAADVIVSRAGASTVSELAIVGKPAILVPLPTAAEDHQTKNCQELVDNDAAILIKDTDANSVLVKNAVSLVKNESKRNTLSNNISKMALRNAAEVIATEVIKLSESK